jgi:hypothetical protein
MISLRSLNNNKLEQLDNKLEQLNDKLEELK